MKKKHELLNYPVVVESCEEGGFFASCPSLAGCHVQGETIEEALSEMRHAIEAYIEDMRERHEHFPKPEQAMITTIAVSL